MTDDAYYELHIFCCTNQRPKGHARGSCADIGALKLRNYMKVRAKELSLKTVRINTAGCLDRCEQGPVMVIYPDQTWYSFKTTQDIDEILDVHVVGGGRVDRLVLAKDD